MSSVVCLGGGMKHLNLPHLRIDYTKKLPQWVHLYQQPDFSVNEVFLSNKKEQDLSFKNDILFSMRK
jgi:hypothetical protein